MSEYSMPETSTPADRTVGRRQRRYSVKDRRRLLKLYENSGLSQKRFCRDQDIPISTLSYWARRSRAESVGAAQARMVEIPVGAVGAVSAQRLPEEPSTEGVEIRLPNQLRLKVPTGADAAWVVELLRGLLTCSG